MIGLLARQFANLHPPAQMPLVAHRDPAQRRSVVRSGRATCLCAALALLWQLGCQPAAPRQEIVVYTALDREFSEPIFDEFTQITGITVRAKYDTEANKTVALANLIMNERARPRCDLFWNNEILNTLRLDRENLLRPYESGWADQYPETFRSPEGKWYGFAARARVLLINREKIAEAEWPQSIRGLTDPRWRGQVGIAKPLFGTTATHAACLFAAWGPEVAQAFFRDIKQNAQIFPGNRQVAQAVGSGQISVGLTDTDDAVIELAKGSPVAIIYPDQADGGLGTLFIPNTLSLISGSPNGPRAERLVEYLLSPAVEQRLADGVSAQIPLNLQGHATERVQTPATVRPMDIDFAEAAARWDEAAQFLRDNF